MSTTRKEKLKKIVRSTGRSSNAPITVENGKYTSTGAIEVNTPEGKRWYKGTGTSRSLQLSRDKMMFDAQTKYATTPSDSLVTGGKVPDFSPKPKPKKKKKFWQR